MQPETPTHGPDFGIAEVFADAFSAFKARVGTHVAFTAVFVFALVVMSCLVGCVLFVMLGGVFAAMDSDGSAARPALTVVVVVLVYGGLFGAMLLAVSAHQAFTLDVTVRALRGESSDLASGLRAAGAKLLSHVGFALVRFVGDAIVACVLFGAILVNVGADALGRVGDDGTPSPGAMTAQFGELGLFFVLAYVVWIVWIVALRGFIGLVPAAIQAEGRSTAAGIVRGVRLLEGRRMQFIAMRIVWGIGWFVGLCLLYAPMVLIMIIAGNGDDARGLIALLLIPYALFFYFVMFLTYAFDAALEGAFYARLVPKAEPAPSVADVFA